MRTVERHHFKRNPRAKFAFEEESIAHFLSQVRSGDSVALHIGQLCSSGRSFTGYAGAVGDKPRTLRALRVLANATVALFELAARPGEIVEVTIDCTSLRLQVPQPPGFTAPPEWFLGFAAACACREGVDALATVRREILNLSTFSHEVELDWVAGLQALVRRETRASALLASVLERAARFSEDALVRDRHTTEIALALRLAEGNADRFNEALQAALIAHRTYWTQPPQPDDIENRPEYPDGFIALGPLGLACLAHDRGIAIEVESEYIPAWIVRKEW